MLTTITNKEIIILLIILILLLIIIMLADGRHTRHLRVILASHNRHAHASVQHITVSLLVDVTVLLPW